MSFYRLLLCSMPLMLTACGDGWEAHRTTDVFPYGNQRTAGSGVVYVRAKMLPEKELVVEAPVEAPKEAAHTPAPVLDGNKIFTDAQVKGSPAKPAHVAVPGEKDKPVAAPADAVKPEAAHKEEVIEEKKSSAADVIAPKMRDRVQANLAAPVKIQSEQILAQEQTTGHPQEKEVSVSALKAADIAPAASATLTPAANGMGMAYEIYPNEIVAPTHSVSLPENKIVSPKKDYIQVTTEGQRTLDQIYEDSF